ncbi:ABC transporter permease [Hahella sp. CCB-MM4]|uniref:FecCD family ABC transporter permease n=1 Tax=Hahella sp. (strain CCB-MM4) TaxID=1926491 RepID=UPI000B9BF54E|nr:iron ABC transporter permease [Hahella sp. CCB-MM4]OZG75353.1 ABC transporter permease [Hahella sp. CCB-MM4]
MSRSLLLTTLTMGLLAVMAVSLMTGRGAGLTWPGWDWQSQLILWEIRLPRTLLAAICGAVLGMAGAVLQGWLRNPLADPGVLGISSMSALGAVMAMYFGLFTVSWMVPLAGILGAIAGFWILITLIGKESGILLIVLAGAALNAFSSAMTALMLNLAPNPFAMQDMLFWLMGSFEHRSLEHLWLIALPVLIGMTLLYRLSPALDVMALGEDTAHSLGISGRRVLWSVGLGTALAVGACVSVAGVISFAGLVVPHLLRPLTQWQPRLLVLPSALAGALLLVCADVLVRMLPPGQELRIGVVTALLGGPFFLWLLRHVRRAEVEL